MLAYIGAKGVASAAVSALDKTKVKFIEVEPHTLSSSALGKSQREIRRFLEDVVTEWTKIPEVDSFIWHQPSVFEFSVSNTSN